MGGIAPQRARSCAVSLRSWRGAECDSSAHGERRGYSGLRLPRDLSGCELIRLLKRYGYESTRQVGSHIRLQSNFRGHVHLITIPDHSSLRIGTLNSILSDVAEYLGMDRTELIRELFEG